MHRINFDINEFDFQSLVKRYLQYEDLPNIHEKDKFANVLEHGTDQNQKLHRMFYDGMDNDESFSDLYINFIKSVIYPRYEEELLYQKFPTFRIHQPDNIAVFGWHRDRDYNHSPAEVNYYLPVTDSFDTNTIWHETSEDKEDYQPMNVSYGTLVEWDGANCRHGNKTNDTGKTRISFDFRILTIKNFHLYPPKTSITKGTKFDIGGYFEILEV